MKPSPAQLKVLRALASRLQPSLFRSWTLCGGWSCRIYAPPPEKIIYMRRTTFGAVVARHWITRVEPHEEHYERYTISPAGRKALKEAGG